MVTLGAEEPGRPHGSVLGTPGSPRFISTQNLKYLVAGSLSGPGGLRMDSRAAGEAGESSQ